MTAACMASTAPMPDAVEASDASCMSDKAAMHEHHGHTAELPALQVTVLCEHKVTYCQNRDSTLVCSDTNLKTSTFKDFVSP